MPPDLVIKLIEIFQTSSVSDFNNIFGTMRIDQGLRHNNYIHEEILVIAETTYNEFLESDEWPAAGSDILAFKFIKLNCWNCEEKSHMSCDCKKSSQGR